MEQEKQISKATEPKKHRVWKYIRNSSFVLLLIIFLTFLLLSLPFIQTFLANQFARYLSTNTDTEIRIGRVDIGGLLHVKLFDLYIIDQEDSLMVNSKLIQIDIDLLALMDNELKVSNIIIDSTYFALRENHQDSVLNINKIIAFFAENDTSASAPMSLKINVERLSIRGAHFVMDLWSGTNFDDGGINYTHLNVKDIDLIINNFTEKGDTLYGNLEQLKAYENSGLVLQDIYGDIQISSKGLNINNFHVRTPSSWLYSDFELKYKHWTDWLDFNNRIRFNTTIDSAQLNMEDIQYFAPSMKGMKDTLRFSGIVKGPVTNIKLRKGKVFFKHNTRFIGDIHMSGLPDIEHSFMLIKAKDLRFNYKDLKAFYLPNMEKIPIPDILESLGTVQIKGRYTGFYNDFVSNATYRTDLGLLTTDLLIRPHHNQKKQIEYHGRLTTKNFHLGGIIGGESYGGLTMSAKINGVGLDKNAEASYNIDIESIFVSKYEYKDINIEGDIKNARITANMEAIDDAFRLKANGYVDVHDSLPAYQLMLDIKNARVARLLLLDNDTLGKISGLFRINMQGDDIDNITGSLDIDSGIYVLNNKIYTSDSLRLRTYIDSSKFRKINLISKWVDAQVEGQFLFSESQHIYNIIFKNIVPSVIKSWGIHTVDKDHRNATVQNEYVKFDFNIKDPEDFIQIFLPKSDLSPGTKINGYFNLNSDSMSLSVFAPKIKYESYYAEQLNINIDKPPHELNLVVNANSLHAKEKFAMDSVYIHSNIQQDTLTYFAKWGAKNNHQNSGHLGGLIIWEDADSLTGQLDPGEIWLNDTLWRISELGQFTYSPHYIDIKDFKIYSDNNLIKANGSISEKPSDVLKVEFENLDLSLLDIYLIEMYNTNLDGYLTGLFELSNIWTSPGFSSSMEISNFYLNGSYLGNTYAHSIYSRSRKAFSIDVVMQNPLDSEPIKYLDLGGFFYPEREDDKFDLDLSFKHFPLQSLQSYLTSFTSDIQGYLDGKVSLSGTLKEPILQGSVKANVPRIKIDYIGETYHFNDELVFTKDYFGLDNIYIYDKHYKSGNRHRALATIQIRHQNYSDFKLFIAIKPEELSVLNLKQSEDALFYGKAIGTGDFKLTGAFNALTMKMDLESLEGSKISIPFSSEVIATQADFITFIHKNDSVVVENKFNNQDDFSFEMDMNIKVKPSTQIQIVMDEVVGDKIMARGNGDIRLTYDKDEVFKMFGRYSIERGDYLFTMQNIINKHFYIEPGGYLEWNGEMESARISLSAVYKTEAKLYDLIQQVDQSEEFKKRASKVNCIINISGSLYNPTVTFDIKVPEENSSTRQLVHQLLTLEGTGGTTEMNKNFISLLVLSRFMPPNGYEAGTNPDALSKNATEMVANQVGNILNKLSDDVEIGLDWNPGDELTTQEVAIALSYSMLDDRLIIDGKFGTGGGSTAEGSNSRFVGDLNVEYKFTKDGRIRGKVFNRTNYYDPLTKRAPYTQGVGIAYRKEFDNLYELFHRTEAEEQQVKRSEKAAKYRKRMRKLKKEKKHSKEEEQKEKNAEKKEPQQQALKPDFIFAPIEED